MIRAWRRALDDVVRRIVIKLLCEVGVFEQPPAAGLFGFVEVALDHVRQDRRSQPLHAGDDVAVAVAVGPLGFQRLEDRVGQLR